MRGSYLLFIYLLQDALNAVDIAELIGCIQISPGEADDVVTLGFSLLGRVADHVCSFYIVEAGRIEKIKLSTVNYWSRQAFTTAQNDMICASIIKHQNNPAAQVAEALMETVHALLLANKGSAIFKVCHYHGETMIRVWNG